MYSVWKYLLVLALFLIAVCDDVLSLKNNFGKAGFINWLSGSRKKNRSSSACLHEASFIHCEHMNHFDSLPKIPSTRIYVCHWSTVFTASYNKYFKAVCLTSSVELWKCTTLTPKYLAFQKNRFPPNRVHWRVHLKALIHLQLTKAITMWWVILFPPRELLYTVEHHLTKCFYLHEKNWQSFQSLIAKTRIGVLLNSHINKDHC